MKHNELSIIDLAYQIIDLHEENNRLSVEVEHYKELHKLNSQTINKTIESNYETVGLCLSACLDSESSINQDIQSEPK